MEVKIMAVENWGEKRRRESILYNTACLKKKKLHQSFFHLSSWFCSLTAHISECSEYIPNSYCQVKMKTFSV